MYLVGNTDESSILNWINWRIKLKICRYV